MVVAEVLDFAGAVTKSFDLRDARSMIASALGEMAQLYLEQGKPLPVPNEEAGDPKADWIERMPFLSDHEAKDHIRTRGNIANKICEQLGISALR